METKPKNRAWVKDAAIVFLVVLLLLTFFSNTIMNHSLPEVATSMVSNGTITAKVRGTGTVTAVGNHKVKAKSNMTIGKVAVKAGQEVNAGDVLFVLGAADSTELEEAMIALEDLQTQYAQSALSVPLADSFVTERNAVEQARRAMTAAEKAYDDASKEYENAGSSKEVQDLLKEKQAIEQNVATANQQLEAQQLVLSLIAGQVAEAESYYNKVYAEYTSQILVTPTPEPTPTPPGGTSGTGTGTGTAENKQDGEKEKVENTEVNSSTELAQGTLFRPFVTVGTQAGEEKVPTEEEVKKAYNAWQELVKKENDLKNEQIEELKGIDKNGNAITLQVAAARLNYITGLQYFVSTQQLKLKAIETQLKTYGVDSSGLNELREKRDQAIEAYNASMAALNMAAAQQDRSIASASAGLSSISNKIKRQQEKIKKLSGEGDENTITANVSGTVTEVNCTAGDSVVKDDILASIEVPDQGYTVSFSVTNDQAKRLHVGDTATISNYYWGNKIVATLATIQTDKKNPMTNKTLTFDLEGDVTSGSEVTLSVGQKSANYDTIIPNSAIRTDSNGSFVLAVTAKNSPLGNRYIAKRVAIEVLAADDTNSAVTADLSNGDYVITTSSAPVANGDMVRLADAEN